MSGPWDKYLNGGTSNYNFKYNAVEPQQIDERVAPIPNQIPQVNTKSPNTTKKSNVFKLKNRLNGGKRISMKRRHSRRK